MKEINIEVPDEYKWVMLTAVLIAFQCIVTNYVIVVKARFTYFHIPNMEKFVEKHQEVFGGQSLPIIGGFPDCGSGIYADKLEYKDWYGFNNSWRVY